MTRRAEKLLRSFVDISTRSKKTDGSVGHMLERIAMYVDRMTVDRKKRRA